MSDGFPAHPPPRANFAFSNTALSPLAEKLVQIGWIKKARGSLAAKGAVAQGGLAAALQDKIPGQAPKGDQSANGSCRVTVWPCGALTSSNCMPQGDRK